MTLEEAKEALAAPAIMELDEDDLAAASGGGCNGDGPAASVSCRYKDCNGTANYHHKQGDKLVEYHYYCSTCGNYTVYSDSGYLGMHG